MNMGLFSLLGVVFITLKILGHITWPWLWVTAPIWGPLAMCIVFFFLTGSAVMMSSLFAGKKGY